MFGNCPSLHTPGTLAVNSYQYWTALPSKRQQIGPSSKWLERRLLVAAGYWILLGRAAYDTGLENRQTGLGLVGLNRVHLRSTAPAARSD